MAPFIILAKSDRLLFLINVISYTLLPGMIYSAFTRLGISKRVSWCWMWILPTAYCFAIQAGSIGNDCFAAVYFLAAVVFSLRASHESSWECAALAFLSAALLTGAKSSNLPLLLPVAFVILSAVKPLLIRPVILTVVLLCTAVVSILPIAVLNTMHAGDWSGDRQNLGKMKLEHPVDGVVGNSLQIAIGAIAPPVYPMARQWNNAALALIGKEPFISLHAHFPRLGLMLGELPMEESAGLGLGITLLLMLSLVACVIIGIGKHGFGSNKAIIFGGLCWIALLAYMSKMGSECAARLVAAYYPGLLVPILSIRSQTIIVRKRFWLFIAVVCQLSVLPALILNPARPLIPAGILTTWVNRMHSFGTLGQRIQSVYEIYRARNDNNARVRGHLPAGVKVIGFAGGGDESEYSFWKPFGSQNVVDIKPWREEFPKLIDVDCIVASDQGLKERFGITAYEFSVQIGGSILWSGLVSSFAGGDPVRWHVICPNQKQGEQH
jgi:hypothetical protein